MGTKRDDFTKKTIDLLGKRVAFHCSNPDCRKITIGPNEEKEKATIIGIAAHITAASSDGPRYNSELSEEEQWSIQIKKKIIFRLWEEQTLRIYLKMM